MVKSSASSPNWPRLCDPAIPAGAILSGPLRFDRVQIASPADGGVSDFEIESQLFRGASSEGGRRGRIDVRDAKSDRKISGHGVINPMATDRNTIPA
jgi:hypothetical protein